MYAVGGGALLPGFADLISNETGLPVNRDPEPLTTVARGAGAALSELDALRRLSEKRGGRLVVDLPASGHALGWLRVATSIKRFAPNRR